MKKKLGDAQEEVLAKPAQFVSQNSDLQEVGVEQILFPEQPQE